MRTGSEFLLMQRPKKPLPSHVPKFALTLDEVFKNAQEIKTPTPYHPWLFFCYRLGRIYISMVANSHPISMKCLKPSDWLVCIHLTMFPLALPLRQQQSQKESLLATSDHSQEQLIRETIENNFQAAQTPHKLISSVNQVNLRALLSNQLFELKNQPKRCHISFLTQYFSPLGIFHCPAFRGVDKAQIGDSKVMQIRPT